MAPTEPEREDASRSIFLLPEKALFLITSFPSKRHTPSDPFGAGNDSSAGAGILPPVI
jgi:hypothetical protein